MYSDCWTTCSIGMDLRGQPLERVTPTNCLSGKLEVRRNDSSYWSTFTGPATPVNCTEELNKQVGVGRTVVLIDYYDSIPWELLLTFEQIRVATSLQQAQVMGLGSPW
jgi:hypothetical protein